MLKHSTDSDHSVILSFLARMLVGLLCEFSLKHVSVSVSSMLSVYCIRIRHVLV